MLVAAASAAFLLRPAQIAPRPHGRVWNCRRLPYCLDCCCASADLAATKWMVQPLMFKKILIANRGEIALPRDPHLPSAWASRRWRSIPRPTPSAAREMADEAVFIGPPPATQSLPAGRQDRRRLRSRPALRRCTRVRFPLREREFARGLAKSRHRLHRPAAKAIYAMGDKIESKKLAQRPGSPSCRAILARSRHRRRDEIA